MYIPKHYQQHDRSEIVAFMKAYSFATIVTASDGLPLASHLPFVVIETGDEIVLSAHFAKANGQWEAIAGNKSVLVIFSEPHAYISPRHYESEMNVPTWNYLAVHVYGEGVLVTDTAETFSLLEAMINNYEPEYKAQWDTLPLEYKERMAAGIVPFQIKVTDIQAKKKLSQNRGESERKSIISAFENSNDSNEQAIAAFMKDNEAKF